MNPHIDKIRLLNEIAAARKECQHSNPPRRFTARSCEELVRNAPAADVRPVVRGKWVAEKEDVEWGCSTVRYRCSHCGRLPHFDKESFKFLLSDFCPKCGADMREES